MDPMIKDVTLKLNLKKKQQVTRKLVNKTISYNIYFKHVAVAYKHTITHQSADICPIK